MAQHNTTIVVIGGTGTQGGATARRLLADGWQVRALVRDPDAAAARALADAGAALFTGDLDRPDSLPAALAGAHGVFLVPPAAYGPNGWDTDLEFRRGRNLVDAAVAAGVAHIVFTGTGTITKPGRGSSAGKHRIEQHIRGTGVPFTLLRPVRFMENYLATDLPMDGLVGGVHRHMFPPNLPVQMIAVADIAAFVALAFGDVERFAGETLEIAGDALTPLDAVAKISAATGRPIRFERLTLDEAAAFGPDVAEVWNFLEAGKAWRADIPALREIHPDMLTFDAWLAGGGTERIKRVLAG